MMMTVNLHDTVNTEHCFHVFVKYKENYNLMSSKKKEFKKYHDDETNKPYVECHITELKMIHENIA